MEVLVGGLAVIILGLVISLAIAAFVIESGQPPKMFRLPFIFEVQAAYGQAFEFEPEGALTLDPGDESTAMVISEVMNKLQILAQNQTETLGWIGIHGDGKLNIRFDNGTSANLDDDTVITTRHSYIPENGYTYRDGTIFKPDGTPLFTK